VGHVRVCSQCGATEAKENVLKILLIALGCIVGAFVIVVLVVDWDAVVQRTQANVDRLDRQIALVKTCKEEHDIRACRELCLDPPSGTDVAKCWQGVRLLERKKELEAELRATCQRISPQRRPAECRGY
jgi:hypothetical protein